MIEHALERLYGTGPSDVARVRQRRRRRSFALAAWAVVLAFCGLPFVYGSLLLDVGLSAALSGDSLLHILANSAANAIVMVACVRLNGRSDRQLASALSYTLLVHGVLAFIILVTRLPYSNQVMLMAAGGSALLGPAIVLIRQRTREQRVAIVGPGHPLVERIQVPCDFVTDPQTDLACYDVVLTATVDHSSEWATALSKVMLRGKPVRLLPEFVEETQGIVSLEHFDLEHLPENGLKSYRIGKRIFDVILVTMALPLALPLLLAGAGLVLLTMGRPVLFIQSRVGLGGTVFRMFKLRTMHLTGAAAPARATTTRDDIRITPVGRWLRRFRIDELPQLWNVLVGDMSVIGPRPEWTVLSDRSIESLPVYAYRHLVRPGITGWAQVKGGYAADLDETRAKVGYDLFYIKNLSLSLDLQILVRTIWTLLSGSGAR